MADTEPDATERAALGAALAAPVTTGNTFVRDESTPGAHAYCDAEIARLHAHVQVLAKEHARHSLAVSAHKARADQQQSRAVHAEGQLTRFATCAEQYGELADLVAELRKRIAGLERACDQRRQKIAEYENAITWETSCTSCAAVLDSSIKEHDRAERAEAKLAAIVAYCRERAEEISDRMLRVRPEDIRIDAGDILAIISAPDGP